MKIVFLKDENVKCITNDNQTFNKKLCKDDSLDVDQIIDRGNWVDLKTIKETYYKVPKNSYRFAF